MEQAWRASFVDTISRLQRTVCVYIMYIYIYFCQVMRESLAKLENLCLGGTSKDQDWMAAVEDTRWAR